MSHQETNRIIPQSNTAVLFIHGILGTPNHFEAFLPLVPSEWSVCNLLLKGHGGDVGEFSKAKMMEWKAQVAKKVDQLALTHQSIIIVAHSMGTLFALQQAIEKPTQIKHLFLLAAPLRLAPKPQMTLNVLKVFFNKIKPTDQKGLAAQKAYSLNHDKRIWRYLGWIPRYLELFAEIRNVRKLLPNLIVPCNLYQSRYDEMVSLSTCQLFGNIESVQINILENSAHYFYDDQDFDYLLKEFKTMLSKENL